MSKTGFVVYLCSFIFGIILCRLITSSISNWSDKELQRNQDIQDSIITERHREQRMIDWKEDSLFYEFKNTLDTLITKANKYDSLMRYEKKDGNIRK